MPEGSLGHARLLEAMAYISAEIHKSFKPFFVGGSDEEKKAAGEAITRQFTLLTGGMKATYLSVAFTSPVRSLSVFLLWAFPFASGLPCPRPAFFVRFRIGSRLLVTRGFLYV